MNNAQFVHGVNGKDVLVIKVLVIAAVRVIVHFAKQPERMLLVFGQGNIRVAGRVLCVSENLVHLKAPGKFGPPRHPLQSKVSGAGRLQSEPRPPSSRLCAHASLKLKVAVQAGNGTHDFKYVQECPLEL